MKDGTPGIRYDIDADVNDEVLNALFEDAWPDHASREFSGILSHGLGHVCAMEDRVLVGFVNIAWDGGQHAFMLDPTVRSTHRRRGIGTQLVARAVVLARSRGIVWLHVDFEPSLWPFYARCGFRPTEAGLMNLAPLDGP